MDEAAVEILAILGDPAFRPDRLLLLLGALVIDLALGLPWPPWRLVPHPGAAVIAAARWFEAKLNRSGRGAGARIVRGLLVVAVLGAASALAGWGVHAVARAFDHGWVVELAALVLVLAQGPLFGAMAGIVGALRTQDIDAARGIVGVMIGRHAGGLDEHGVAREAVESTAATFCGWVASPAFWYLLLGLPGMFAAIAVTTADRAFGHRQSRYAAFGLAASRLEELLNYGPARLAAVILALAAALVPTARPAHALVILFRRLPGARRRNGDWCVAAMAGALDLALAGPRRYGSQTVNAPWIGDGRARALVADVRRARTLFAAACLVLALVVGMATLLFHGVAAA